MDTTTNVHVIPNDTSQSTPVDCPILDYHREPDDPALNEDPDPNNFRPRPFDIHPSLVTNDDGIAIHHGHEGQGSIHTSKEPSDTLTARSTFDCGDVSTAPQSTSHQVIRPIVKDVRSSECLFVPADGSMSVANTNGTKADTIIHSLEPPLLPAIFPETASGDEVEPEPEELLNCIQMSLELVHDDGLDRSIEEEHTREDFDDPSDDIPSSVPPSSSPPQLFSSSPCISSQSSSSDVESSKMLAAGSQGISSPHDYLHADDMAIHEPNRLESKNFYNHDIADVTTSPGTDTHSSEMLPASSIDRMLGPSAQRTAADKNDHDESYGPQPTKRPKLDLSCSSPPAPKRATVASQDRQFKKLTAPFRPPSKLPIATGGPGQARNRTELNVRSSNDTKQNESRPMEPTTHPFLLQNKASKTPRSVTQFKSPLVNRILSADTRAVRLTPAVQTLERKLQLLKRAVKVKEDKEEEVLVQLAGKWIEAGREVAYEVWDATKDAGDLEGRAASIRRPHGWGSADDRNVPWGWDTKPEDAGEESSVPGSFDVPFSAERFAPDEEDDDTRRHTLGTMLRQLGIAPGIFGWDDDKEAFSD